MSEQKEQIKLVQWADLFFRRWPELMVGDCAPLVATPNEGKRSAAMGARMKAQGLRAGFPDLFLHVQSSDYRGLAIEMKWKKNTTTQKQEAWLRWLSKNGFRSIVCYNFESAKREIEYYMKNYCGKMETQ